MAGSSDNDDENFDALGVDDVFVFNMPYGSWEVSSNVPGIYDDQSVRQSDGGCMGFGLHKS